MVDLAIQVKSRLALLLLMLSVLFVSACSTTQPKNIDNVCEIFQEKSSWYEEASDSQEKWGSPISTMMAFMRTESSFIADIKPPRMKILGFIPGPRKSSAYGYSQAKDEVWEDYENATGNYSYDRDDFGDAMDFLGWYNALSKKRNNINLTDTKNLYLAYHEGHGGYKRKTYASKSWLLKTAEKVSAQSQQYKNSCKAVRMS